MKNHLHVLDRAEATANILCIEQFSNLGGGQRSLLDLLPAFYARGWNSTVAIPGEGPFSVMVRESGYRTHQFALGAYSIRRKPLMQMLKYAFELPTLVDSLTELTVRNNIDLLYVNGPRMVPPAAWVAWRQNIPLVFHCHNRLQQNSVIALTGQALELANAHVVACCEHAAAPLREYVERRRLSIIYNGIPEIVVNRRRLGQTRNIGVVGRIEVEKGQLEFVRAARLVSQNVSGCRFVIIGSPMFSGSKYYNKVVASSRGLPIEFVDWQDDIGSIYSGLDLLVVPSSAWEATTRVIPEAFSAGVPVVAFPAGGIPEILEDGQTGFLTSGISVESLAERIISVLRMDKRRLEWVTKRANHEWKQRFTIRAYRDSVCDVLAEAMHPQFGATTMSYAARQPC